MVQATSGETAPAMPIGAPVDDVRFIDLFQKLIDALPEQIALVDDRWVVLAVNPAWTATASLYGYQELCPGANYAAFCEARASEGHNAARLAVEGIRAIDAGLEQSFHYLYDGNDRWEGHTFRLAINRLEVGGRTFATITRYDVTELIQLRRQREDFGSLLIETQANEGRRLARDLHDSTQQLLVSVDLALGQLRRANRSKEAGKRLEEVQQSLDEVQQEIRSFAYLAHPPVLASLGLRRSLEVLVQGYGGRTGLATTFRFEGDDDATWPAADIAVYRIVQEALSNVHRHAQAKTLDVGLSCRKSMIHAVISDDGIGMPAIALSGVGVAGMRERLNELGGRLSLRRREHGTSIIATVPRQRRIRAVGDLAL
jgi:two-component system NarL family sensor kinase